MTLDDIQVVSSRAFFLEIWRDADGHPSCRRQGGVLGEGSFGKVVLVHTLIDGQNEQPMALKVMAKSHIIESDQQVQVMREKQVLMTLPQHPFIVELYATFQVTCSVTCQSCSGRLTSSPSHLDILRTWTTCIC